MQPDVIFLNSNNAGLVQRKGIYGSPDLVIEILSSNKSYDQVTNFELYQRNQIKEYIMVDADTKEVWAYQLTAGVYQLQASMPAGQLHIQQLDLHITF